MTVCAPNETFLVGDKPTIRMTFRDIFKALADPVTITVTVSGAGLSQTVVSPDALITQESTGVWLFELPGPFTQQGDCWLTVTAAGNSTDKVEQTVLRVRNLVHA